MGRMSSNTSFVNKNILHAGVLCELLPKRPLTYEFDYWLTAVLVFLVLLAIIFLDLLKSPVWTLDLLFCVVIKIRLFLPFFSSGEGFLHKCDRAANNQDAIATMMLKTTPVLKCRKATRSL
jgi:hypothetical protein